MKTGSKAKLLLTITFILVLITGLSACNAEKIMVPDVKVFLDTSEYTMVRDGNVYYVEVPDGRPRVPQVSCDQAIEIHQAYFAVEETEAVATVRTPATTYKVVFRKNPRLGFVLQYDDRYTFKPEDLAPSYFTTSDATVATVDRKGVITIVGVSDEGVTITAGSGSEEETLTIDKTVKAPLDVYLLTGQSNAAYYYAEPEKAPVTKLGTAYQYDEIEGGGVIQSLNNDDGTMRVGSIEASLCKSLYEKTGEKTLIINAGISGMPIASFIPFEADSYMKVEQIWGRAIKQVSSDEFLSCFEPRLRSYIWIQGETDDWTDIDKYKRDYVKLHQVLTSQDYYNLDYGFIVMVRSAFSRPCDAQEQLAQAYDDIIMATRESQYFSVDDGTMRFDDLHYAQDGDNILGQKAANTIANVYIYGISSVPEGEGMTE